MMDNEEREFHTDSFGIFFKTDNILFEEKSEYQQIKVIENETFGRVLLLDGLVQTTEKDEFYYHEMLVHPAVVAHPDPQWILIIGGGDGGALKEILSYPVLSAVLVEIDEKVIEVARSFFPWLEMALQDSRAELVVKDGRKYLDRTEHEFDIVIVDSSDPVGPSVSLHEKEFYKAVKKRLAPGGVVVAQMGSPFYHLESLGVKRRFLREIFNVVRFYTGPVPTYPGGTWSYVFLSDTTHPGSLKRSPAEGLKYYSSEIHKAAFVLPFFLKEKLE